MCKEFVHIRRDGRSLLILFLMPLLMILLYGYAINFDIKEFKIGLLDQDATSASRMLVDKLTRSNYFKIAHTLSDRAEIERLLKRREVQAVLIIPRGYGKELQRHAGSDIQLVVDGSNANTALIAGSYLQSFCVAYSAPLDDASLQPAIGIRPRILYNPDLKSTDFIVPGLSVVIMMMICTLLTSLSIARERESGTMEQILVSPIHPLEIIIGKVAPYILLALLDAASIIAFSVVLFQVPLRGSALLLLLLSICFIYAALSIGVLISSRARSQQTAMIAANVTFELPSLLLSGFIYPISSLPIVLQVVSHLIPTRHFILINRGIMLKGLDFSFFYTETLFLLLFGSLLLALSVLRFKTNLEE